MCVYEWYWYEIIFLLSLMEFEQWLCFGHFNWINWYSNM